MAGEWMTGGRAPLMADRYEPLNVLAVGGQATVVRALDHQHGRVVALKIRPARGKAARAAALAEARTLLDLEAHRGIAVVRNDFFVGDDHVLVMEHVDGGDLAQRLDREGTPGLPAHLVVGWMQDVACALDHLHGSTPSVVHGDVKPGNIVIASTPPCAAVLVDFGHASATAPSHGTHHYAAPELAQGERNPASDVFALAATTHALLTGSPPEPGVEADWSGLSWAARRSIRSVLSRGLATDQSQRPPSAGALVESLVRAADATGARTVASPWPTRGRMRAS